MTIRQKFKYDSAFLASELTFICICVHWMGLKLLKMIYQVGQRENRLRASLEKFITLHKARAVYLGGRGRNKNFT